MGRSIGLASLVVVLAMNPIGRLTAEQPITLVLPLNCKLGSTCFIQTYVDHDPGPDAHDYACGTRSYDGHDGTDIRIPSLDARSAKVEVVAAASGRVLRMREGMDDISIRAIGKEATAGRECGNGLVIDHAGGWTTQYCHLAKGSLRVKPGDPVTVGQSVGRIGLSGDTEFPHVHFTVRKDDKVIDPFAFEMVEGACNSGISLWASSLAADLAYRESEIINLGFAGAPVNMASVESGEAAGNLPGPASGALVAYVRAIGLKAGDEQTLTVAAPDGRPFASYRGPPLDRDKAQFFLTAGRKRNGDWAKGAYTAKYTVIRRDAKVLERTFVLELK
jgi:murein DD-endopeptidase MepM/ murein hydrolase activator NlpD